MDSYVRTFKSVSAFQFNMKRKLVKYFIASQIFSSVNNFFRVLKVDFYCCHLIFVVVLI